jgi:serine/threonine-protein kinase RsbW
MMAETDDDARGVASPGIARSLTLEAHDLHDVAELRHDVVRFLRGGRLPSTVVDDLELVVSELVTNAIVHRSAGDAVAVLVMLGESIDVEVANHGSAAAVPPVGEWRVASPDEMSGRGLGIVRRLCDEAAIRQDGERVVVACRRHLPDGRSTP